MKRQLAAQNSFDDWNALGKLLSAMFFSMGFLLLPFHNLRQIAWALLWIFVLMGELRWYKIHFTKLFVRTSIMLLAMGLLLPLRPLNADDILWLRLGPLSFFREGTLRVIMIWAKGSFVMLISLLVVRSTPYLALIHALQRLHMPAWVLAILLYMYRLFFVLQQELFRIQQAIKSRVPGWSLKARLRFFGKFSAVYLARIIRRSQTNYQAMISRGFTGQIIFDYKTKFALKDGGLLILSVSFMVVSVLWI